MMATTGEKHVFISYVRDNTQQVDEICRMLGSAGIPYWRDREDIKPGEDWQVAIADAIRDASLIFLACFSQQSVSRRKSGMNDELNLACEESRKMQPGATWLIPVRLDECTIPKEWELRPNYSINRIQRVDLFGQRKAQEAVSLIERIRSLSGDTRSMTDPESAVQAATSDGKPLLLRQTTEDLLLDPASKIQLSNIVDGEVREIVSHLQQQKLIPLDGGESEGTREAALANTAIVHMKAVAPFCYSLQVAAWHGDESNLQPWVRGIRSLASTATKQVDGYEDVNFLRHLVLTAAVMTAALSSTTEDNWVAFRDLIATQKTNSLRWDGSQIPLLLATGSFVPFRHSDSSANLLALTSKEQFTLEEAVEHFTKKPAKFYTPYADWLHHQLRPIFEKQIPDDEDYDLSFDRAEVIWGLVSMDMYGELEQRENLPAAYPGPTWYGRSLWRSMNLHQDPIAPIRSELELHGSQWSPLAAGLFGGQFTRAVEALDKYEAHFREASRGMWR